MWDEGTDELVRVYMRPDVLKCQLNAVKLNENVCKNITNAYYASNAQNLMLNFGKSCLTKQLYSEALFSFI